MDSGRRYSVGMYWSKYIGGEIGMVGSVRLCIAERNLLTVMAGVGSSQSIGIERIKAGRRCGSW